MSARPLRKDPAAADESLQAAAALLSRVAPTADSPQRRARVRARLAEHRLARGRAGPVRMRWIVWVTLTVGTAASAMWGTPQLFSQIVGRVFSEPRPSPTRVTEEPVFPPALNAPTPAVDSEADMELPAAPLPVAAPAVAPRHRTPVRPASPQAPAPELIPLLAEPAAEADLAAAQVLQALMLIRQEHRASEAEPLLEDYLRLYPMGPLADAALGLRIEAALSATPIQAPERARDYLRRFPSGQFRALAEGVLDADISSGVR